MNLHIRHLKDALTLLFISAVFGFTSFASAAPSEVNNVSGTDESGTASSAVQFNRFALTVGAGAQFKPLPNSLMGFAFFAASLGYFISPGFFVLGEVGSHPSTGASDYGRRANEVFFGLHLKTFWGAAEKLIENRNKGDWEIYVRTGLETRQIETSSSVTSSSDYRRRAEGSRTSIVLGGGIQKTRGFTTVGCDLLRVRLPVDSTIRLDEGGMDAQRDEYFKETGYDIGFIFLGISF